MSARARILIVDDEANARRALRTLLEEDGYELAEAKDGEEALGLLPLFQPDVVLSDVRMPRMDGLTLLGKAKEAGSGAAFVMMTAFGSVEAAVEAMRAGAEQFLLKPLDVGAVSVVLEKRRLVADAEALRERVRERYGLPSDAEVARFLVEMPPRRPPCRRVTPRVVDHRACRRPNMKPSSTSSGGRRRRP